MLCLILVFFLLLYFVGAVFSLSFHLFRFSLSVLVFSCHAGFSFAEIPPPAHHTSFTSLPFPRRPFHFPLHCLLFAVSPAFVPPPLFIFPTPWPVITCAVFPLVAYVRRPPLPASFLVSLYPPMNFKPPLSVFFLHGLIRAVELPSPHCAKFSIAALLPCMARRMPLPTPVTPPSDGPPD